MARRIIQRRRIVEREYKDAARDVQAMFDGLLDAQLDGSTPPGFESVAPEEIQAGVSADAGSEDDGWASASHVHSIETATAVGLSTANAEGTGTALARADHTHKRDVRVKAGATDNVRNAVRFVSGTGITVTAADDSGDDETEVTVALAAPLAAEEAEMLAFVAMCLGGAF